MITDNNPVETKRMRRCGAVLPSKVSIKMAERRGLGLWLTREQRVLYVEFFDFNSDAYVLYKHAKGGSLVVAWSNGLAPERRRQLPAVLRSDADIRTHLDVIARVFGVSNQTNE